MAGLLNKLENNEAILLMHLADELPAEDRAEVEQMLQKDTSLRAALEALSETQHKIDAALGRMDAAAGDPSREQPAVHRLVRQMRRWQLEHQPPVEVPAAAPAVRHRPWWSYPAAAAAAVLLVLMTLWGVGAFNSHRDSGGMQAVNRDPGTEDPQDGLALGADPIFTELETSFGRGPTAPDDIDQHLQALQSQEDDTPLFALSMKDPA